MSKTQQQSGFAALHVSARACQILEQAGIIVPTEIQASAIPVAMAGHDLIGIAKTGTGKTLAFALPIVENLKDGQQALVIAPTRELADQIEETFDNLGVRCALVIGGASMHKQVSDLRRNPRVIIATPGRLLDHMERGSVRLKNIAFVVLDEADRMLDMGFAPGIKRIMSAVPEERQTMLFSATMPKTIEEMAANYLKRPKRIETAPQGTASELVQQELIYVPFGDKNPMLAHLVKENRGTVLVFARTRHGARKLAKMLRQEGHSAAEIHSDRTLAQRREALYGFKNGQYRVLVATDIAARGIDVKEISVVINFDVPENPEDYVHRIGRTGRAGAPGRSITIALEEQVRDIFDIEKLLGHELPISKRSTVTPPRASAKSPRKPKKPVATHEHVAKPSGPFARFHGPSGRKRTNSRRPR